MRKSLLLTTFLLLTLPTVSAFACVNGMSDSSTSVSTSGFGLAGAWLMGVFLHFLTLPMVGRNLTARLASLGACLSGVSLLGLSMNLRFGPSDLLLGGIVLVLVSAVIRLYVVKNAGHIAEEERIQAEAPQVF